ncbi:hypothetical protein LEP1GSC076_0986 [Leptospira sp. Fiocruz LV4135]|nr:hypothetical protein LEP1GSC076_0986 [Leptospira sp. Fiocruz LV4135]
MGLGRLKPVRFCNEKVTIEDRSPKKFQLSNSSVQKDSKELEAENESEKT